MAAYEEFRGQKHCVRWEDTRSACASVFGVDRSRVGFKAEFGMGVIRITETYDEPCVKNVGNYQGLGKLLLPPNEVPLKNPFAGGSFPQWHTAHTAEVHSWFQAEYPIPF